jgi:O-antigen/teichoic acid export membrane protein
MVLLVFPLALLMIHGQFLQAEKRVADAVFVQTGLLPLLSIAAFALLPVTWSLSNMVTTYVSAALVTLLISVVWYLQSRSFGSQHSNDYDFAPLATSARSLAVSDLINKVIQPWAPVIFLGFWSTATDIGLFAAANRLAALIVFATLPVNRMLAPKMSALWAEGETAAFFKLSRQAAVLMFCVSLPIALALLLAPELLLGLFGKEFVVARTVLWVLAAGQLLNALTGPVRSMLIMTGHERDHRMSSVAGGVVILVLSFALIPDMQAMGAALAAAAGMVVNNLYAALLVWRRLGVVPLWK